jgi:3-polyprenyl-4-hydroxybenzoate decarboxylase
MDNVDFAVLSRIQELGDRYNLKPYHFVATLDHSQEDLGMGIKFVIPASTDEAEEKRARKMLKAIGVDDKDSIAGGEIAVIDALDNALEHAPRPRRL